MEGASTEENPDTIISNSVDGQLDTPVVDNVHVEVAQKAYDRCGYELMPWNLRLSRILTIRAS